MKRGNFIRSAGLTSLSVLFKPVCSAGNFTQIIPLKHPEAEILARFVSDWPAAHAACVPVLLNNIVLKGFLGEHWKANINSIYKGIESSILQGFESRAAGVRSTERKLAADSDLYKWIEGASYVVALTGDKDLEKEIGRIAEIIVRCQHPDGYINTQVPPGIRFDPKINHDLYTAGHFFEAAVAHYRATGKKILLDTACRWADYLISEYKNGNPYFETIAQREHSEYELGFLRLARATGKVEYLDSAIRLTSAIPLGPELFSGVYAGRGHAVRINYFLSACADLYLETGRQEYRDKLFSIWEDIILNRSFITGGVSVHERYSEPHYLPQVTDNMSRDIAESCTSISLAMLSWRLHSILGESRIFDHLEKVLYNHLLGAVPLNHLGTFYYNPLKMLGLPEGKTDHGGPLTCHTMLPAVHSTSCCIPNEWRFFAALGEYLYSFDKEGVFINLYSSGSMRINLPSGIEAALDAETLYPHNGRIMITLQNEKPAAFTIRLRIPGWCSSGKLKIPGKKKISVKGGSYTAVHHTWKKGDKIHLELDMPVRMILPDPREKENEGQAVLARGPLIYCLEQKEIIPPIQQVSWDFSPGEAADVVSALWKPDLLGGIYQLLAPGRDGSSKLILPLIPYYTHANRGEINHWITFLPLKPL